MRKLVLGIAVIMAFVVAGVAGADVRVLETRGIVRVAPAGTQTFTSVNPGMILPVGVEVSTGDEGYVKLEVSPGNVVSLRGNSRLVVREARPKATRFQLLAGRIKGVFSRMIGGEKFDLQFGDTSVVASVKGTVLEAGSGPEGNTLNTLLGAVELLSGGHVVLVPQGCGAAFKGDKGLTGIKVLILTDKQIEEGLGNDGNSDGKNSLKSFVINTQALNAQNKELVTQLREEDFSVGRSLKDVHGNLCRVDQRLLRPDPYSLQFVNLVKRDSYSYKGKFSYNGPSDARLDYLSGTISFNMALPDSVNDWPGFFFSNKDTIEAVSARMEIANGGVNQTRDIIERTFDLRDRPEGQEESEAFLLNGVAYVIEDDGVDRSRDGGEESLWVTNIVRAHRDLNNSGKYDLGDDLNYVSLQIEGYCINQDGKIMGVTELLSNTQNDPIGFAKTLASEGIFSAVDMNGNSIMRRGNIDLVFIPDLAVAIVTKYASSLASLDMN